MDINYGNIFTNLCYLDKKNLKNINTYINMTIKPSKSRYDKISEMDFEILSFDEYEKMQKYNYNVKQMRSIAKYYKLKVSGNKYELKQRLYKFLKNSYFSRIIQKNIRRYFVRCLIYNKGPGLKNRELCNNNTDFYTLDNIKEISFVQFLSYKDEDNFVYGFDIQSLFEYFKNDSNNQNPYNRKLFPNNFKMKLRKIVNLSNIINLNVITNKNNIAVSENHYYINNINIREKTIELFQKIDHFGHITNVNWFFELSHVKLIRFIRELYDIWNYRAQLTRSMQIQIVNPSGNPFHNLMYREVQHLSFEMLQRYILKTIENLITKGVNHEACSLGIFYVLSALTLVSEEAAQCMPWLYQSVQHS